MSNATAIAAVAATMRNLLDAQISKVDADLNGTKVTLGPPDLARKGNNGAQVNLFLYQVAINAAWSNQDMPFQVRPGETAPPPLALNLHFLMTAFGGSEADNDAMSLRVLGSAMSVLHSHPLLGRAEIEASLPESGLDNQIERIRISSLPISVDEISKLWTVFQAPYRTSVAYEATVVLIDSRRAGPSPLPVLRRGEEDRGAMVTGQRAPSLSGLELPNSQPAIWFGEQFALVGGQLQPGMKAIVSGPLLADDVVLTPDSGEESKLLFKLAGPPDDAQAFSRWAPGFFTISVRRHDADGIPPISSNSLSLALAPRIAVTIDSIAAGTVTLSIECLPRIRATQRVLLMLGDRQIAVAPAERVNPPDEAKPTEMSVAVDNVTPGTYVVRLRVDGVDSIPVIRDNASAPPKFDPAQMVVVP